LTFKLKDKPFSTVFETSNFVKAVEFIETLGTSTDLISFINNKDNLKVKLKNFYRISNWKYLILIPILFSSFFILFDLYIIFNLEKDQQSIFGFKKSDQFWGLWVLSQILILTFLWYWLISLRHSHEFRQLTFHPYKFLKSGVDLFPGEKDRMLEIIEKLIAEQNGLSINQIGKFGVLTNFRISKDDEELCMEESCLTDGHKFWFDFDDFLKIKNALRENTTQFKIIRRRGLISSSKQRFGKPRSQPFYYGDNRFTDAKIKIGFLECAESSWDPLMVFDTFEEPVPRFSNRFVRTLWAFPSVIIILIIYLILAYGSFILKIPAEISDELSSVFFFSVFLYFFILLILAISIILVIPDLWNKYIGYQRLIEKFITEEKFEIQKLFIDNQFEVDASAFLLIARQNNLQLKENLPKSILSISTQLIAFLPILIEIGIIIFISNIP